MQSLKQFLNFISFNPVLQHFNSSQSFIFISPQSVVPCATKNIDDPVKDPCSCLRIFFKGLILVKDIFLSKYRKLHTHKRFNLANSDDCKVQSDFRIIKLLEYMHLKIKESWFLSKVMFLEAFDRSMCMSSSEERFF